MLFAFTMDIETAMLFYQRADAAGAKTEEERSKLLMQMVEEGLIKNVVATQRTEEQYLADLQKNFNVLDVNKLDEEGNEPPNGDVKDYYDEDEWDDCQEDCHDKF